MKITYTLIRVFAEGGSGGNPAAVIKADKALFNDAATMQRIANTISTI